MKTRLLVALRTLAALCVAALATARPLQARELVLQDGMLRVAFDRSSGALIRLEDKTTGWVVERRPELGVSFRLFAPLPERRWNPVLGQEQLAKKAKKLSDHEVLLQWKNLASESDGKLPMTLTAIVTLTNGVLTFNGTLENDSPLTVETLDYPYLGDLNPPARDSRFRVVVSRNGNPDAIRSDEIYPLFHNEHGYWGVFWPLITREAQDSLFCLMQSADEGLYIAMDVPRAPYRMQYTFELHPGVISAITSMVPQEDEISGIPVHLEFRTCHFLFARPHSTVKLAPIVMRCYRGDWHEGVDLYRQQRTSVILPDGSDFPITLSHPSAQ